LKEPLQELDHLPRPKPATNHQRKNCNWGVTLLGLDFQLILKRRRELPASFQAMLVQYHVHAAAFSIAGVRLIITAASAPQ
jgi:hypothetical protein